MNPQKLFGNTPDRNDDPITGWCVRVHPLPEINK